MRAALAIAMLAAAGCASSPPPAASPVDRDPLLGARLELVAAPRNPDAHARVGRLELAAGNRGEALTRLAAALRNGAGSEHDREAVATLLIERIEARVAEDDPNALADVERFERFMPTRFERWRRSRAGRELAGRARDLRAAVELRAPGAAIETAAGAADARLPALLERAEFADGYGARRAAFETYTEYVRRGGRSRAALERWAELVAWRLGDDIDPVWTELSLAREAGANLCPVARHADELGCGDRIRDAAGDPMQSRRLWRRARARGWRTSDPQQAADWLALSLQAWTRGDEPDWEVAARARLDLAALDIASVPPFARATAWRLAGRRDRAAAALARAMTAAVGERAAEMTPAARAVLVAEAAAQERAVDAIESLAERLAVPAYGWLAPLAAARAAGDEGAAARMARRAGARALAPLALDHLQAEPRRPLLSAAGVAPTPAASTLLAEAWSVARPPPLRRVERAYRTDPALADRRAREWVARSVWPGRERRLLVREFWRLGDTGRARAWADAWLADSPDDARAAFLAAAAAAVDGDVPAARVLLVEAAAVSGDPGLWLLAGARVLLRTGEPLATIGVARRALEHTPRGRRAPVFDVLGRAQRAAGRHEQARRTETLRRGDAGGDRAAAPAVPGSELASGAGAGAGQEAASALAALDRRIAWQPLAVEPRIDRLARTSADQPRYRELAQELWTLGTAHAGPDSDRALSAAAGAAAALGERDAARVALRELERRRRDPLEPDPLATGSDGCCRRRPVR